MKALTIVLVALMTSRFCAVDYYRYLIPLTDAVTLPTLFEPPPTTSTTIQPRSQITNFVCSNTTTIIRKSKSLAVIVVCADSTKCKLNGRSSQTSNFPDNGTIELASTFCANYDEVFDAKQPTRLLRNIYRRHLARHPVTVTPDRLSEWTEQPDDAARGCPIADFRYIPPATYAMDDFWDGPLPRHLLGEFVSGKCAGVVSYEPHWRIWMFNYTTWPPLNNTQCNATTCTNLEKVPRVPKYKCCCEQDACTLRTLVNRTRTLHNDNLDISDTRAPTTSTSIMATTVATSTTPDSSSSTTGSVDLPESTIDDLLSSEAYQSETLTSPVQDCPVFNSAVIVCLVVIAVEIAILAGLVAALVWMRRRSKIAAQKEANEQSVTITDDNQEKQTVSLDSTPRTERSATTTDTDPWTTASAKA